MGRSGCGIVCGGFQHCQVGLCVEAGGFGIACAPGLTPCGADCFDLASDAANCGACGNSCPLGGVCQGGVCVA